MNINLTANELLFAAGLALFLTWVITTVSKSFRIVISRPAEFLYPPEEINKIIQRCYNLFPKDSILFRGKTYKRGMNIRIKTNQHKIIEGQLIGQNKDNMVCVLTTKYVVAQDLENIEEIFVLESQA